MAKKKGLAAYKKRASKRAKKNNDIVAKSNPPALQDLAEFVVPGFAGYAGTRMASRVVHGMILKRFPKLAKHASVLSTVGAAGAAWLLVHRIDRVKQYHTPVVVGASIAAIQTAVQAYLPKYGWMVSDHNLNVQPGEPMPQLNTSTVASPRGTSVLPAPVRTTSVVPAYNTSGGATGGELPPPIATLSAEEIKDELEDLDMGVLSSGFGTDLSDDEMDLMIDEAVH